MVIRTNTYYRKFKPGELVRYTCPSIKHHGIHVFKNNWTEADIGTIYDDLSLGEYEFFKKPRIGMIISKQPKHRIKAKWMINGANIYYKVLVGTKTFWIHHSHLTPLEKTQ